jgi:hypothetical protein
MQRRSGAQQRSCDLVINVDCLLKISQPCLWSVSTPMLLHISGNIGCFITFCDCDHVGNGGYVFTNPPTVTSVLYITEGLSFTVCSAQRDMCQRWLNVAGIQRSYKGYFSRLAQSGSFEQRAVHTVSVSHRES